MVRPRWSVELSDLWKNQGTERPEVESKVTQAGKGRGRGLLLPAAFSFVFLPPPERMRPERRGPQDEVRLPVAARLLVCRRTRGVHKAEAAAWVGVSSSHLTASCNITSSWLHPHIKLPPTSWEF